MGWAKRAILRCGALVVRPLRRRDEKAWLQLRTRNRTWLRPWEATSPPGRPTPTVTFRAFVRRDLREWRARFMGNLAAVRELGFDERFIRMWEFYLAQSEAGFSTGQFQDLQITLAKRRGRVFA